MFANVFAAIIILVILRYLAIKRTTSTRNTAGNVALGAAAVLARRACLQLFAVRSW